MKTKLHNLLERQIKRAFGKTFDLSTQSSSFVDLLCEISKNYEELYKEKRFLEHTLEMNSEELTKANLKIQEQNRELQKNLEKSSYENEEMIHRLEQYKEAIDTSLIVSITSPEGVIKYVNDNFVSISGFSREELIGAKHNIIKHPQNPKSFFKDIWQTILSKKVWQGIISNRAKDGSTYHVNAVITPLLNRNGEIVEFMALRKDITQIEEARIKSLEAEREKANFLANMSHEIRTPMNAILGFSELLAKTQLDAKQSKYITLIRNSSATLIQIINDILDFSKLESGHNPIELSKINPFMEFENTLMLLALKAREKEISYMIEIDPLLGECIEVDSFHIKQILTNLIGNAIKFTPSGGTVHVKLQKLADKVRFCVEDSGIGIAKEKQKKIFEPFSQADSSTTRKFGGTGLGLSISNTLVTLMQSKLVLESTVGVGSKFYFDIAYLGCDSKTTLKEHLKGFNLYLFGMDTQSLHSIGAQLEAYGIEWSALQAYDKTKDRNDVVIIAKEEQSASVFEKAKILSLAGGGTKEDARHHSIEVFEEFPSLLYNELMRLEVIKTELQPHTKKLSMHLLAAEDYEINRVLLEELLLGFGVTYDFALNGQEAVEKAKANHYDLILMDVNMPVMNGLEATRILLEELHIQTPIVALTANALEGDKERFLSLGMVDYLTKPIDTKALEAVLSRYALQKEEHQEPFVFDINASLESSREKMRFSEAIMQRVFASFAASLETLEQNMYEGCAMQEFAKIHINAHNLKSGAASLGFETLAKIAAEIEAAAKKEDVGFDFERKLQEIAPYLEAIKEFKASLG